MATLTGNIDADDRLLLVTGDTSTAEVGRSYRIDDEVVLLSGFDRYVVTAGRRPGGRDRNRWLVQRGVSETAGASHTAGAEILAVSAAVVSSGDLTTPAPFADDVEDVEAPEVPATPNAQDVVDALVTLGLVTQAAP
jgi:hypothetical protein